MGNSFDKELLKNDMEERNQQNNHAHLLQNEKFQRLQKSMGSELAFFRSYSFLQMGRDINFYISINRTFSLNFILESIERTLSSIRSCINLGNFSDAHILMRKFRDDLFFYVYANIASNEILKGNKQVKERIIQWLENRQEDLRISEIFRLIGGLEAVIPILKKYHFQKNLQDIADELNNFTHSNGVRFYNKPAGHYSDEELTSVCEKSEHTMQYLTVTFVFLLALVKPVTIMSPDLTDNLDFGFKPHHGSEYWVAPFIEELLTNRKNMINKECLSYLRNVTGMEI